MTQEPPRRGWRGDRSSPPDAGRPRYAVVSLAYACGALYLVPMVAALAANCAGGPALDACALRTDRTYFVALGLAVAAYLALFWRMTRKDRARPNAGRPAFLADEPPLLRYAAATAVYAAAALVLLAVAMIMRGECFGEAAVRAACQARDRPVLQALVAIAIGGYALMVWRMARPVRPPGQDG
jgi:hypothetical protein